MKNLRKRFERFCFKNRNKGIPNLMLYVTIGSGLVYLLSLTNGGSVLYDLLQFDKQLILQGQIWRLFTYIFTYSLGGNPILVVVGLVCIYSIGKAVENLWGTFRFNLFYLSGAVLMVVFAMICCPTVPAEYSVGNEQAYYTALVFQSFYSGNMVYYLNMTLLIAYATLYPDAQFYIFFIIPIKAWILGLLYLVLNAIEIINLCYPQFLFPHCLFPLVGFANYLLFFGKDIANLLPPVVRINMARSARKAAPNGHHKPIPFRSTEPYANNASQKAPYHHRCTVCGRTDVSDPELEFRYCSQCNGYHCYCQDHINNHTHI